MKNRIKNILLVMMIIGFQNNYMYSSKELMTAIDNKDLAKINTLIASGVNVNSKIYEMSPLFRALASDGIVIVHDDNTITSKPAHIKIIEALINAGANPNDVGTLGYGEKDEPILFIPVQYLNFEAVKKLVEAGADVNAKNENGQTILFFLKRFQKMGLENNRLVESKKIEEYLLSKGAQVN